CFNSSQSILHYYGTLCGRTAPFSQRREKKCLLEKRLIRRLAATDCYGSSPVAAQDVSPF
ncbi:MAG: hypothetical protein ACK56I_19780, partial [bacterium]